MEDKLKQLKDKLEQVCSQSQQIQKTIQYHQDQLSNLFISSNISSQLLESSLIKYSNLCLDIESIINHSYPRLKYMFCPELSDIPYSTKYINGTNPNEFMLEHKLKNKLKEIKIKIKKKICCQKLSKLVGIYEGDHVIAIDLTNQIVRGVVTVYNQGPVTLTDIDTGEYKIANRDNIYSLDEDAASLFALSVKCCLDGNLSNINQYWTSELGNYFKSALKYGEVIIYFREEINTCLPPEYKVVAEVYVNSNLVLNVNNWICDNLLPTLKLESKNCCDLQSVIKNLDASLIMPYVYSCSSQRACTSPSQICSSPESSSRSSSPESSDDSNININIDESSYTPNFIPPVSAKKEIDVYYTNENMTASSESMMGGQTKSKCDCGIDCSFIVSSCPSELLITNPKVPRISVVLPSLADIPNGEIFHYKFGKKHYGCVTLLPTPNSSSNNTSSDQDSRRSSDMAYQNNLLKLKIPLLPTPPILSHNGSLPMLNSNWNSSWLTPKIRNQEILVPIPNITARSKWSNNRILIDQKSDLNFTPNFMNHTKRPQRNLYSTPPMPMYEDSYSASGEMTFDEEYTPIFSNGPNSRGEGFSLKHHSCEAESLNQIPIVKLNKPVLLLEPGQEQEAMISYIDGPSKFFVNLLDKNSSCMNELEEEMKEYYSGIENRFELVSFEEACYHLGDYVAGRWSQDNRWYRAQVIRWNQAEKKIKIMFVDHGNIDSVSLEDLQPLNPKFCKLPILAQQCHLANIAPFNSKLGWCSEANKLFREFCKNENELFTVTFQPSNSNSSSTWSVLIRNSHSECINDLLVDKDYAVKDELNAHLAEKGLKKINKLKQLKKLRKEQLRANFIDQSDYSNENSIDEEITNPMECAMNKNLTNDITISQILNSNNQDDIKHQTKYSIGNLVDESNPFNLISNVFDQHKQLSGINQIDENVHPLIANSTDPNNQQTTQIINQIDSHYKVTSVDTTKNLITPTVIITHSNNQSTPLINQKNINHYPSSIIDQDNISYQSIEPNYTNVQMTTSETVINHQLNHSIEQSVINKQLIDPTVLKTITNNKSCPIINENYTNPNSTDLLAHSTIYQSNTSSNPITLYPYSDSEYCFPTSESAFDDLITNETVMFPDSIENLIFRKRKIKKDINKRKLIINNNDKFNNQMIEESNINNQVELEESNITNQKITTSENQSNTSQKNDANITKHSEINNQITTNFKEQICHDNDNNNESSQINGHATNFKKQSKKLDNIIQNLKLNSETAINNIKTVPIHETPIEMFQDNLESLQFNQISSSLVSSQQTTLSNVIIQLNEVEATVTTTPPHEMGSVASTLSEKYHPCTTNNKTIKNIHDEYLSDTNSNNYHYNENINNKNDHYNTNINDQNNHYIAKSNDENYLYNTNTNHNDYYNLTTNNQNDHYNSTSNNQNDNYNSNTSNQNDDYDNFKNNNSLPIPSILNNNLLSSENESYFEEQERNEKFKENDNDKNKQLNNNKLNKYKRNKFNVNNKKHQQQSYCQMQQHKLKQYNNINNILNSIICKETKNKDIENFIQTTIQQQLNEKKQKYKQKDINQSNKNINKINQPITQLIEKPIENNSTQSTQLYKHNEDINEINKPITQQIEEPIENNSTQLYKHNEDIHKINQLITQQIEKPIENNSTQSNQLYKHNEDINEINKPITQQIEEPIENNSTQSNQLYKHKEDINQQNVQLNETHHSHKTFQINEIYNLSENLNYTFESCQISKPNETFQPHKTSNLCENLNETFQSYEKHEPNKTSHPLESNYEIIPNDFNEIPNNNKESFTQSLKTNTKIKEPFTLTQYYKSGTTEKKFQDKNKKVKQRQRRKIYNEIYEGRKSCSKFKKIAQNKNIFEWFNSDNNAREDESSSEGPNHETKSTSCSKSEEITSIDYDSKDTIKNQTKQKNNNKETEVNKKTIVNKQNKNSKKITNKQSNIRKNTEVNNKELINKQTNINKEIVNKQTKKRGNISKENSNQINNDIHINKKAINKMTNKNHINENIKNLDEMKCNNEYDQSNKWKTDEYNNKYDSQAQSKCDKPNYQNQCKCNTSNHDNESISLRQHQCNYRTKSITFTQHYSNKLNGLEQYQSNEINENFEEKSFCIENLKIEKLLEIKICETIKLIVTSLSGIGKFYCQLKNVFPDHEKEFHSLFLKTNDPNVIQTYKPLIEIKLKKLVMVQEQRQNKWYRAIIIEIYETQNKVKVFFVDFGTVSLISIQCLREIDQMFTIIPFQAAHCSLNNIIVSHKDSSITYEMYGNYMNIWKQIIKVGQIYEAKIISISQSHVNVKIQDKGFDLGEMLALQCCSPDVKLETMQEQWIDFIYDDSSMNVRNYNQF